MTLLSWWSNLDTRPYFDHSKADGPEIKPQYDSLFLNRAVMNPPSKALQLNETRTELRVPYDRDAPTPTDPAALDPKKQTITNHRAAVIAGLGIVAADLSLLLAGEVKDELNLGKPVEAVPNRLPGQCTPAPDPRLAGHQGHHRHRPVPRWRLES